jgi:hypothetical protein
MGKKQGYMKLFSGGNAANLFKYLSLKHSKNTPNADLVPPNDKLSAFCTRGNP